MPFGQADKTWGNACMRAIARTGFSGTRKENGPDGPKGHAGPKYPRRRSLCSGREHLAELISRGGSHKQASRKLIQRFRQSRTDFIIAGIKEEHMVDAVFG